MFIVLLFHEAFSLRLEHGSNLLDGHGIKWKDIDLAYRGFALTTFTHVSHIENAFLVKRIAQFDLLVNIKTFPE
jgi:hypothetical protein